MKYYRTTNFSCQETLVIGINNTSQSPSPFEKGQLRRIYSLFKSPLALLFSPEREKSGSGGRKLTALFSSAPPFPGPRRHAMVTYALIGRSARPQHSRSALLRCAVLAHCFDNGFSRMPVRVPVHGMQALFELQ